MIKTELSLIFATPHIPASEKTMQSGSILSQCSLVYCECMVLSKFKPLISQRFVTKILDRWPRSYCFISLFEFLIPFPFSIFLQQNDGVVISFLFCSLQAALFCIFLLCMSYSLLHASTKLDPTHYSGALDSLRGFCEVITLLMVVFYICEEINQIRM